MFICRDRGKKKREEYRVEGEIYLPAARADKIIRQKTPGMDEGEGEDCDQVEERGALER